MTDRHSIEIPMTLTHKAPTLTPSTFADQLGLMKGTLDSLHDRPDLMPTAVANWVAAFNAKYELGQISIDELGQVDALLRDRGLMDGDDDPCDE